MRDRGQTDMGAGSQTQSARVGRQSRIGYSWKSDPSPSPGSLCIEGCTPQFFLHFSLEWVLVVGSDTPRKRLEALGWLLVGGLLPLPRVSSLKGV
jgi:hypothetical protein